MKHGSLFSGIGGFDLASEWMGWENVFHCEWMPFPRKVLDYYWPNADSHIDICETNFEKYANQIDVLTGGFPCQPFSLAGKRKGKEDERYLWGEMLRAVREIKPKFVIAENVFGITNIDGGLVFEQVCIDLENEGYEVQPFIIPACAKNAPHRRDRVWFVAYSNGSKSRNNRGTNIEKEREIWGNQKGDVFGELSCIRVNKNTNCIGQKWRMHKRKSKNAIQQQFGKSNARNNKWSYWKNFPTQYPICSGNDGLSEKLDGITFSKWRAESIKGYGNAIVPQIAFELFQIIEQMNHELN